MEFFLALPGLVAGFLISWFFNQKSSGELRAQVDELREDNKEMLSAIHKLGDSISPTDTESLAMVKETLDQFSQYTSAEVGVFGSEAGCPQCHNQL